MLNNISTADGYTEPGYIAERKGLHAALKFTYRPMLMEERDVVRAQWQTKTPLEAARLQVQQVVSRLVTWDNKDAKGETLPIKFEQVRTLRPNLLDAVYAVISGAVPSDPDPDRPDVTAVQLDAETEAILNGTSIGAARELADAKN